MRKRIVVLIALLMALILLFVGCAQADVTGTSAEDYREPIDEEFEDYELDDFFDDQEERYNAYPDSYDPEPCSDLEPTEDISTVLSASETYPVTDGLWQARRQGLRKSLP